MIKEVKPKEQPMLFSTPMVKALIDGSKTETRRDKNLKEINEEINDWKFIAELSHHKWRNCFRFKNLKSTELMNIKCPWQVGNILWAKETWKPTVRMAEDVLGEYPMIRYKADGHEIPVTEEDFKWFRDLTKDGKFHYQSSMFMRRKFARIFLKIESIGIERLHDITKESAIAEGIERERCWGNHYAWKGYGKTCYHSGAVNSYKSLWESINGSESWDLNPYIWVIKFSKIENYGS